MSNQKIITINYDRLLVIAKFSLLVGVASIMPLWHNQWVTGPIVNATLFLTAWFLGIRAGIMVGLIPSAIALGAGLLPTIMAPMVPFIMISNAILVLTVDALRKRNYWLSVIIASGFKFLFLAGTSSIVINLLIKKEVAAKVATMMNWPQLATALIGGIIAFAFIKYFKRV